MQSRTPLGLTVSLYLSSRANTPLISGISCELAGYAFSRSSFEGDGLHAVGSASKIFSGDYDVQGIARIQWCV